MGRAFAGLWAFLVLGALACDEDARSHVFLGQLFEPARGCLDPSTSIDVVQTGAAALTCAPACLVLPAPPAAGAEKIYVSTMCGPYPSALDVSGTDPLCPAALDAYARGPDVCQAGGGSDHPPDGGGDDAGGDDAGNEAGASDAESSDADTDARDAEPLDAANAG